MRLAVAAAALVILFNACGSFCLAENHDDMHGVNHPLVSIHLDGDPLQLSDDGQTELTFSFSVRGLLPGFTYNTVVHECDENGVPGRQSNHTVVSMDRDASSNEGMRDRQVTKCKMGLRVLDAKRRCCMQRRRGKCNQASTRRGLSPRLGPQGGVCPLLCHRVARVLPVLVCVSCVLPGLSPGAIARTIA